MPPSRDLIISHGMIKPTGPVLFGGAVPCSGVAHERVPTSPPPVRGVGAVLHHATPCIRKDHSDIVGTGIVPCSQLWKEDSYVQFGDVEHYPFRRFRFLNAEWALLALGTGALRLKLVRYSTTTARIPGETFSHGTGRGLSCWLTFRPSGTCTPPRPEPDYEFTL